MIEPYHKYPNLLDVLFNFLKTEQTSGVRREVIRVLGLLGALDPYKHRQHQRNEKRSKMGTPTSKPMDKKSQGTGESGGDGMVDFRDMQCSSQRPGDIYILVVRSNSANAWRASKYISIGKDDL